MVQQQMAPGFVVQMQETCPECGGRGNIAKSACPHCGGRKVVSEEKTLTGHIEKGMPSDAEIRFERESEQAPGVTPGDVIFKLKVRSRREGEGEEGSAAATTTSTTAVVERRVAVRRFGLQGAPHPRFRREGDNLHHEMHLSLKEVRCQWKVDVGQWQGDGREAARRQQQQQQRVLAFGRRGVCAP